MEDLKTINDLPELSQEQLQATTVEEEQVQEEVVAEQPKPQVETAQARNFKAMREKAERLERENEEIRRALQAHQKPQQAEQEEPEYNVNADDYVEGKHLNKVGKEIRALKEQLKSYQQQSAQSITEAKIKAAYPDFNKVVNTDNIEMLKDSYPELYNTINSSTDLYSTAVSAYTLIKKLGIHQEDVYVQDKAMALKNAAKPKPLASVSPQQGDSPLSKANAFANGLTEELKEQLRREMYDARKNR